MSHHDKNDPTRERLLDEAEILFAQKGFHAVSIREITSVAKCNLAAVNYHFGNKENLYLEIFRSRVVPRAQRIRRTFEKYLAAETDLSPSAVIHALAQAFLQGPLSDKERLRHHQLMMREISEPTGAFEIVEQAIRPLFDTLYDYFNNFMPAPSKEKNIPLMILSIVAQVLYFNSARELVKRITGAEYDAQFKNKLVNHIVEFSLKGLSLYQWEQDRDK